MRAICAGKGEREQKKSEERAGNRRGGLLAGIDLGTSAVKVLLADGAGTAAKARKGYLSNDPEGWLLALCTAFSCLDGSAVEAIGLSSQVGTYIFNRKETLSWQEPAAFRELKEIRTDFDEETFIREISMPHPELSSYPAPRILWRIRKGGAALTSVCQPKEIIMEFLTGKAVSDPCSWRGLADQHGGGYSKELLRWIGIEEEALPELKSPFEQAGRLTKNAAEKLGLRPGIPVYIGCNDYYAALLGMGISGPGQIFDITGTSEHAGMITRELGTGTNMISSPYFKGNVLYGVTASGGVSLDFGIRQFQLDALDYEEYRGRSDMPVFLPYLKGERAPIFDEDARGVFFGIGKDTTHKELAYAILEGAAFSVWDIFSCIRESGCAGEDGGWTGCVYTSGGAARNPSLNQLKADLFGIPVCVSAEEDTSAFGGCIIAAAGEGWYAGSGNAAKAMCRYLPAVQPGENPVLAERFKLYRDIYRSLKKEFKTFRRIVK